MIKKYHSVLIITFCTVLAVLVCYGCGSMYYGYGEPIKKESTKRANGSSSCYKKCIIPNLYDTILSDEEYVVYTGNLSADEIDIEEITLEIRQATTKWVKRKADKNCLAADPEDCLVWCLVGVPAQYKTFTILNDTTQSKDYEIKRIEMKELVRAGGKMDWRAVFCQDLLSIGIIDDIQIALVNLGYSPGGLSDITTDENLKLDDKTIKALVQFKKDNGLPLECLDLETLSALDVAYEYYQSDF